VAASPTASKITVIGAGRSVSATSKSPMSRASLDSGRLAEPGQHLIGRQAAGVDKARDRLRRRQRVLGQVADARHPVA